MAKPPEPIGDVLPQAARVFEAEVTEVISVGPVPEQSKAPPGTVGAGRKAPSQVVRLKPTRFHRGPESAEVVAEKPVAGYALRAGSMGVFLLDASTPTPLILGRYGPDTWPLDRVLAALASK